MQKVETGTFRWTEIMQHRPIMILEIGGATAVAVSPTSGNTRATVLVFGFVTLIFG